MDNTLAPIPSTSPQPAVEFAVSSPTESPNRRWFLWSSIGLVLLALGIAIGIFSAKFFNQSQGPSQLTSTPTPTLSPILSPTPDLNREPDGSAATANWKTYTNLQNQYSVKYPPEITLSSYQEGTYSGIHLLLIGPTQTASGRTQTTLSDGVSIKTLMITDVSIPLQQYAEQRRIAESQSAPKDDPQPTVSNLSEVLIDGKSGYRYTIDDRGDRAQVTLVFLNGNILQIVTRSAGSAGLVQQYVSLIDQILSTFHFLK